MSKSRLEHLFDDLETHKYECITDKVVDICRNDYYQLLKQSGLMKNAKTSMNDLLGHVEYHSFPLASSYVKRAREEYKYLLDKISKLNTTKQIEQQGNTTYFLHNNIPKQNTGSGTPIHDHQRSQIPNTTHIDAGPAAQNTMFGSNDRPFNHIKVNQWVAPTTDLNITNHETLCPPSQSVQGSTTLPDQGENLNHETTGNRSNNYEVHECDSKSYDNIQKYSKQMLKDCLPTANKQTKNQATSNMQSRTNISVNSEPVTVIYHHNNPSADNKITTTKTTLNPGGAVPLKTTTTNSTTLTEMPQSHVQNDDRKHNERQTKYMGQTSDQNRPPRTSHNANIESEEAKLSRGRAASAQLRKNNPNIVDLSDNNRPTKLAEKFSEMYDNEWTEAFECLEIRCNIPEKIIISLLLDIVTKAFQFSKTEKLRIVTIMENAFDSVLDNGAVGNCNLSIQMKICSETQTKARKSDTSMLEQYLKENASRAVPRLQKDFCEKLQVICKNFYLENVPVSQGSPIFTFANRCVELTWWMCVQDPPIYIDTATVIPEFNATTYRAYTRTGRDIDYYVWPALLLEQGGAVLMKGVAQCK